MQLLLLVHQDRYVRFNTSQVPSYVARREYHPLPLNLSWSAWPEPIVISHAMLPGRRHGVGKLPQEQLQWTQDTTDYLTYLASIPCDIGRHHVRIDTCEATRLIVHRNDRFVGFVETNHHQGNCSRTLELDWSNQDDMNESATCTLSIVSISLGTCAYR